jgi:hypothetical protein
MATPGKPTLAPYTTPQTSDHTLAENYGKSNVTLGEKHDAETLSSNLDVSEQREVPENRPEEILEEYKKENVGEVPEEEAEYPSSFKLLIITLALCLSILCMALDNTIIATAIPKITDEFPGSIQGTFTKHGMMSINTNGIKMLAGLDLLTY